MSRSLYVLGARQRKLVFKSEDEPHLYEAALILEVQPDSGTSRVLVDYKTPPAARASDDSSNVFKCGTLQGNLFYTCTSTEVLIFEVPSFRQVGYVSLPCFNDLHHVTPSLDGNLLVANTGLDMVVKFTAQGESLVHWNVLGGDPWSRFSPQTDYRKIDSTKPHQSHPNYVFELDSDLFVTRFRQRDAICVTDPSKRIDVAVQTPHDGLVFGDGVYFTTVDGHVVVANRHTLKVERVVDLNTIENDEADLLGWCRGLLPLDPDRIWVSFTRVRKTRFKENLLWVKHAFRERERPTHMALYDLSQKKILSEVDLEQHGMNVVFGMYPAAELAERGNV